MGKPQASLRRTRKPEILAPVGGWPQLHAAIENGADAVYFGLHDFNARARAHNFSLEELPKLMAQLHDRGVLGFVTFNTLLFDHELERAEEALRAVVDAGVDAVIGQDLVAVQHIRAISPDMPIHASTQMTVTSAESATLAANMGIERVVLARELSTKDIRWIAEHTEVELEVFVHGALCVSYSGQCFSSEAWGGRSANRGKCAQACRLPYDMIVDGEPHDLGPLRYLLSPQDLMGVDQVAALVEAGVSCFKIEGRLKGPEYVALTTRTYREAVDKAWTHMDHRPDEDTRRNLQQIFSRGLTPGFLDGVYHQRLVEGRAPKHRGVLLGEVTKVTHLGVTLTLNNPVKRGDGLVFDAGNPQDQEQGGRVYEIFQQHQPAPKEVRSGEVELRFGPNVNTSQIFVGDKVWKTRDEALEAAVQKTWAKEFARREPITAMVQGAAGQALSVTFQDPQGNTASATSEQVLQNATGAGLDEDRLTRFLGRLGQTPFVLEGMTLDLEGSLFLPTSALNDVRRRAAQALREVRQAGPTWKRQPALALPGMLGKLPTASSAHLMQKPSLTILCRTLEQVEAALDLEDVNEVTLDFLEIKGLKEAVRMTQAAHKRAIAAAPRILKPREERIWRFMLNLEADALLVRGLGLLHTLRNITDEEVPPLHGDYSLNATNALSLNYLLKLGLTRLAPGHDLNADQLCALAQSGHAQHMELIVHHHLPLFHTEHCVFCRFLSDGNSFRDCGHPCEEHGVHLQDREGRRHVVIADMGCRNTVFNAEAQSGASHLPDFLEAGYRRFRIELLEERAEEIAPLANRYMQALQGQMEAPQLWRWLSQNEAHGVTLGSLVVVDGQHALKTPAR